MQDADIMYAGTQPNDSDKRLWVTFTVEPRLNKKESKEAGENMYRDVEFVTIRIPGDKLSVVHRPVQPADKMRFPLQYAAFRNAKGDEVVGTPLSLLPGVKPSQVKELEFFNVRTIDQLAAMPDGSAGAGMMGILALRNAAKNYIKASKEAAPLVKVQQELETRDATIAAQAAQIEAQGKQIAAILAALPAAPPAEGPAKKGK